MRMWMLNPKFLCDKHLLGEHGEIHKFKHNFVKKHNMNKRVKLGQIDHTRMGERHDEIVVEMLKRGMNHQSPYESPDVSYIVEKPNINLKSNEEDLRERCSKCFNVGKES